MTSHENEGQKVTAPIDGMYALAKGLAELPPDQALYKRDKLKTPATDTFGTHTERRRLVDGRARIQQEIDAGAGYTLMFSTINNDGTRKVIGIGRTPDKLGTDHARHEVKDYLMLVHDGTKNTPPISRFLSAEQLSNVSVAPGDEDLSFNPVVQGNDPASGLVIQVQGRVESVVVLE